MTTPATDSLDPGDDSPDAPGNDDGRISAWALIALRKGLPSELAQKPALRWPGDVSSVTHISTATLKEKKDEGDHPRLYAIGRALFTTIEDVREWLLSHELAPGQLLRPATIPKGAKRPVKKVAA